MKLIRLAIAAVLALTAGGCTTEGLCDPQEIVSALFRAFPGDIVTIGTCRVVGSFTVPAGVNLVGQGPDKSILFGEGDEQPVLLVMPGAQATRVADLLVQSDTLAGVLLIGEGQAVLERIGVEARRGIGIGAEDLDSVRLSDITLTGPIPLDEDDLYTVPPIPSPQDISTHGLVLAHVADAVLTDVEVTRFAGMGVLLVNGSTVWQGHSSSGNLGTGVMVHAGFARLQDLVLCRALQGPLLVPPYAAVFVAGAQVETENLEVCESERVGLFHDSADATHLNLRAHNNMDAAVWVQNAAAHRFEVGGAELTDNGFASLLLMDVGDIVVHDGSIDSTVEVQRFAQGVETGNVTAGDGLHLVRPLGPVVLRDLLFSFNERIGMLLELEGERPVDLSLERVVVDGTGEQLGAHAQGDEQAIPRAWDAEVNREGAPVDNDPRQTDPLTYVALQEDPGNVPNAEDVAERGLAAIIGDL
jgi:hypothetical protein